MISLSNQRSYHGQTAAIVANKSGLRNYVLSKSPVPASTAEVLRGTDFAAEGVFGELPSFFLEFCDSTNGKFLTCRPKPSVRSSSDSSLSIKRISSAASQQSFKKLKLSSYSDQGNVSVDQKEPEKRNPLLWECQRQGESSKAEIDWLSSLAKHKEAWERLGDPVATSNMTTGLRLEFSSPPPLSLFPPQNAVSSKNSMAKIRPFLPDWIKRGVVR